MSSPPSPSRRSSQPPPPNHTPIFVSIGSWVLNQVHFANGSVQNDVPGGTGLYATLGARIVTTNCESSTIGCIILIGNDFSGNVMTQVQNWGMNLLVRQDSNQRSTRGRLDYHDDRLKGKSFSFLTPPLTTQIAHLQGSTLLNSATFHFRDAPDMLSHKIAELQSTRIAAGIRGAPNLVWEPKPSACQRTELESHLRACKLVNVFSPNHLEISALVNGKGKMPFSHTNIETCADRFLASGVGSKKTGYVVVRCGEHGSLARSLSGVSRWYPPYHTSSDSVVDATGAGNAFLGGFAIGMMKSRGDITEGIIYGSVAASLVMEQFGVPVCLTLGAREWWNGVDVEERIQEYRERVRNS